METSRKEPKAKGKPEPPKPPLKKSVAIRFGDVAISVEGECQEKVKQDAMDIFAFLEKKYGRYGGLKGFEGDYG